MKKLLLLFSFVLVVLSAPAQVNTDQRWIDPYYRKDGTYVEGHYRSNPNGIKEDNINYNYNYNGYYPVYPYAASGNNYPVKISRQIHLGEKEFNRKQYAKAIDHYTEAAQGLSNYNQPNDAILYKIALSYLNAGHVQDAAIVASQIYPKEIFAYFEKPDYPFYVLGLIFFLNKNYEGALGYFSLIERINPNFIEPNNPTKNIKMLIQDCRDGM